MKKILLMTTIFLLVTSAEATELSDFAGKFVRVDAPIKKTETLCREYITLKPAISRSNQLWIDSYNTHEYIFQTFISLEKTGFYFTGIQTAKIIDNSLMQKVYHGDSSKESYELKLTIEKLSPLHRRLAVEFTDKDTNSIESQCVFESDDSK